MPHSVVLHCAEYFVRLPFCHLCDDDDANNYNNYDYYME